MSLYDGLQKTAFAKVKQFGKKATIVRSGASTFNAETGESTISDVSEESVYVVEYPYDRREIDGAHVLSEDRRFYATTEQPVSPGDTLKVASDELRVVNAEPLSPGDKVIMTIIQARR